MLTPNIGEKSRRLDNETRMEEGVVEAATSSMTTMYGAFRPMRALRRVQTCSYRSWQLCRLLILNAKD